jgi:hypothetical protein
MLSIGDSVTEGMLNLGDGQRGPFDSSGRLSFSNQLAALLNVENWNVAFGGSGFTRYINDNFTDTYIPYTHDNYLLKSTGVSADDPFFDIVLIAAGNNDGQGGGYSSQYQTLLSRVIANNPTALIFCIGPTYNNVGDFASAISAVNAYNSAHGTAIHYITTSPLTGQLSLPYLGHPSVADDTNIANYLSEVIAPYITAITTGSMPVSTIVFSNFSEGIFPDPAPFSQMRLGVASHGPLRYRIGRKTYQIGFGGNGPVRMMTSQGVKVLV